MLDSLFETMDGLYKALPAKARREFPVTLSQRKTSKLPGLGSATSYRITLSRQALNELLDEGEKKLDAKEAASMSQWAPPKGPLTLTLLVLPNANGAGSDWLAVGLDEKPLTAALTQLFHPTPGSMLASRSELAPFLAQNPLSLSYGTFLWQSQLIRSLLDSEGQDPWPIGSLFEGLTFTATSHVVRRGAGSEAVLDYYVSAEGLSGVRALLGWDVERFQHPKFKNSTTWP